MTPFISAIPGLLLQFMAHHHLLQRMICISDGRLEESEGSLRSGFVTSSFREQIPGGPSDSKAERRHAPGGAAGIGSWFVYFKNKLLKQGKGHTNCLSIHFHAGRGNNGRGAAGKGLCHGYRPVAENVGGAALVQS